MYCTQMFVSIECDISENQPQKTFYVYREGGLGVWVHAFMYVCVLNGQYVLYINNLFNRF